MIKDFLKKVSQDFLSLLEIHQPICVCAYGRAFAGSRRAKLEAQTTLIHKAN